MRIWRLIYRSVRVLELSCQQKHARSRTSRPSSPPPTPVVYRRLSGCRFLRPFCVWTSPKPPLRRLKGLTAKEKNGGDGTDGDRPVVERENARVMGKKHFAGSLSASLFLHFFIWQLLSIVNVGYPN